MNEIAKLIANNRAWATNKTKADPSFFQRLKAQQTPDFLWIGCADSRVPANDIVGLDPGELFVHRNVANLVSSADFNCLSVLQFAIEVLKVKHILVVGHYGCGGVRAALDGGDHGMINNWISPIKDIYAANQAEIDALPSMEAKVDRMCELSVMQQVRNVAQTPLVQRAWGRGQPLAVHGWCYGIADGLVRDLGVSVAGPDAIPATHRLQRLREK